MPFYILTSNVRDVQLPQIIVNNLHYKSVILAVLVCMWWYLIMVFICNLKMTSGITQLFLFLDYLYILVKFLLKSLVHYSDYSVQVFYFFIIELTEFFIYSG